MSAVYLDKGEFADDVQRVVGNDDLAVMVNPLLTTEQVVYTRRRFVPCVQLTWPAARHVTHHTSLVADRISATATASAPKLRQKSVSARFWFQLTEFRPSYGYGRNQHRVTAACRKCSTSVTFRGHGNNAEKLLFVAYNIRLFGFNY